MSLTLVASGIKLATAIVERSNNKEARKYLDEYLDAKKKLDAERSKPMADQLDNVIEHYEATVQRLMDAAFNEIKNGASK